MTDYPNWFEPYAKPNFEQFLVPLKGKDNLKFLQLGVFTGDASVWLCEHTLTGKDCWLIDVDTWEGSAEEVHESMDFDDVYATYITKTQMYKNILHHFKSTTTWFLQSVRKDPDYDFIYIDADHTTVGVLMDAELSWPQLKAGGIMAFDDYTWGAELPVELAPKLGIDLFLARHESEYEILVINSQVWIKKNDN
jgi:predicted O-methyltransferase YrrM